VFRKWRCRSKGGWELAFLMMPPCNQRLYLHHTLKPLPKSGIIRIYLLPLISVSECFDDRLPCRVRYTLACGVAGYHKHDTVCQVYTYCCSSFAIIFFMHCNTVKLPVLASFLVCVYTVSCHITCAHFTLYEVKRCICLTRVRTQQLLVV
jgi:hypothetical protein